MNDLVEKFLAYLDSLPEEQRNKLLEFLYNRTPKGWLNITEHAPLCKPSDFLNGGTTYRVRDINDREFFTVVADEKSWIEQAKCLDITHWLNE